MWVNLFLSLKIHYVDSKLTGNLPHIYYEKYVQMIQHGGVRSVGGGLFPGIKPTHIWSDFEESGRVCEAVILQQQEEK